MQNEDQKSRRKSNIVLVADDDFFMRAQVKLALENLVQVIEADSGEQVLELYKRFNPAVLLLDIHMPKMNGKLVLKDILNYDPTAYVIMLSADSQMSNVRETHAKGASGFITKPFTKEVVLKYVTPMLLFDDSAASGS